MECMYIANDLASYCLQLDYVFKGWDSYMYT